MSRCRLRQYQYTYRSILVGAGFAILGLESLYITLGRTFLSGRTIVTVSDSRPVVVLLHNQDTGKTRRSPLPVPLDFRKHAWQYITCSSLPVLTSFQRWLPISTCCSAAFFGPSPSHPTPSPPVATHLNHAPATYWGPQPTMSPEGNLDCVECSRPDREDSDNHLWSFWHREGDSTSETSPPPGARARDMYFLLIGAFS